MTERVHSSTKLNGNTTTSTTATKPATTANPKPFPPTKSQLYNPNRHPYRPQPNRHRRSRRRVCCLCCFWSILVLLALLLLTAIASAAIYVLYRPSRPTFSLFNLKISQFNLSTTTPDDTTRLTTKLNLTLSSKNTNKKLIFYYDPIKITTLSSEVQIASGSFPNFVSNPNNITIIHSTLLTSSQVLDVESVNSLRSDLRKSKNGLPIKILMDTKVVVKMDWLESNKVGIRVTCDGIHGLIPKGTGKSTPPSVASTSNAKCKVDLRIKIWKWTF